MFTIADIGSKRLENVLVKDKSESPNKLIEVLKSDISELLKNYMDVEDLNIDFEIINGGYVFKFEANAERIKSFGILPN